jgi:hypothetical protein
MPYIYPWPKGTRISQRYGTNPGGVNPSGGHTGMDGVLPVGTPLRAPADGTIRWADWCRTPYGTDNSWLLTQGGGICVVLDAGPGKPNFILAHLNKTDKNKGDRVKQGDIIGYSGNTGTWTTGPHCHFEVMLDGYNLQSSTYGRANPDSVCSAYWEDLVTIQVQGGVTSSDPGLRKVTADVAMIRVNPWAAAAPAPGFPEGIAKGANLAIVGYVKGEDPFGTGDNAWYKTKSGFYVWANNAENNIAGLKYLGEVKKPATPAPAPKPAPPAPPVVVPSPQPTEVEVYDFALDFTKINGITVEKIPAQWDNYGVDFPAKPAKAVCHWWNSLDNRPDIENVIAEFCKRSTSKSPHFMVSDLRIIQIVSLSDRAFHAGPGGNDWVGIEIDPRCIEKGADGKYTARALKIQANVRGLLEALKGKFGYKLPLTLHKDVPGAATACSELVLADFDIPDVAVPTTPPAPLPAIPDAATIRKFIDWLSSLLKKEK